MVFERPSFCFGYKQWEPFGMLIKWRDSAFCMAIREVGAISWNSTILSTGSRDKTILHRDLRANTSFINKLIGHKQEICGLKWSFDEQQLCWGGNDNKLLIWNNFSSEPILKFNDHVAAVKAMAWSPHQHGLLVWEWDSQQTIRFRNTLTGSTLKTIDVGSQVCNTYVQQDTQLNRQHSWVFP